MSELEERLEKDRQWCCSGSTCSMIAYNICIVAHHIQVCTVSDPVRNGTAGGLVVRVGNLTIIVRLLLWLHGLSCALW